MNLKLDYGLGHKNIFLDIDTTTTKTKISVKYHQLHQVKNMIYYCPFISIEPLPKFLKELNHSNIFNIQNIYVREMNGSWICLNNIHTSKNGGNKLLPDIILKPNTNSMKLQRIFKEKLDDARQYLKF